MSAAFGMDALFSRKGEAAPAVQPAIPTAGRNRFEDLARALGHSVDPEGDGDAFEDEVACADSPAASPEDADTSGRVTPFRRPEMARQPTAPLDDPDTDSDDDDETAAESEAADQATRIGYGMIRRAKPAGQEPTRPWESVRQTLSRRHDPTEPAPARRGAAASHAPTRPDLPDPPPWVSLKGSATGVRQTLTAATGADPEDIEIFLFGPDQAGDAAHNDIDPGAPPRRRHVSVRLPTREHELLRQFARLCGSTQQDVLRRSLLTYMIDELRRRLNEPRDPDPDRRA